MKYMYPSLCFSLVVNLLAVWQIRAQSFNMSNAPINSCSGFFYDSGGASGNYGPNQNFTTRICPQGTSGTHVQLIFSAPDIHPSDQLCFYDGNSAAAPLLACAADFEPGQPFVVQATATNASGCITITFISDATNQGAGWSANIKCVPACQIIQANLVSSDPPLMPADTGYIDICPGQRVFFNGAGSYPQNGLVYNHSDLTSTFQWNFGDGGNAVGPNVSYVFNRPGGYVVQLTITDQFGCKNTNFLKKRVRVSPPPTFQIGNNLPSPVCAGDTITLTASVDTLLPSRSFSVRTNQGSFQSGGIRSDSLPLPDGTGVAFQTSINFTDFSPGQVLTNINDLQSICVNMEHSWLHDLEVSIICPSGQTVILHNFISPPTTGGAGETHLGIPVDPDPPGHPNAIQTPWGVIVPGTGWDYCWTPNATRGTWRQYATANQPGRLPSGNYNSFQPLTNLLGCPLNGEWTLRVIDRWAADNGFIFNWSINFNPNLYPRLETFTPQIVDFSWRANPTIIHHSSDSIAAVPVNAGTARYTFRVTDNFGCTTDSALNITVLPPTHPNCYNCADNIAPMNDTLLCAGQSAPLNARPAATNDIEVRFEAQPYAPFGFSNHPPANPFNSTIAVNNIRPLTLTDPTTQILSVCIDIETDWCSDLRIFLRAPNGALLELSTNNGGSGDNYTNTCFSPTATTFIQAGTPPFTGFFRPEGMWSVLNNTPINGNWTLVASDGFGINDMGRINWWSITFNSQNNVTYTWSPTAGLSCTNCPNPVATPTTTTTYTVQTLDSYNCSFSRQVTVRVANDIPAPTVVCFQNQDRMVFTWNPVDTFTQYEYRVILNGTSGAWQGPIIAQSLDLGNAFSTGDEIRLEVRAYLDPSTSSCQIGVGNATCQYEWCTLSAALSGSTTDVSCNGQSDGTATVVASGGSAPYQYFLDGSTTALSSGALTNLSVGPHSVVVEDARQCRVTVNFTINEPPVLQANIVQTQAISCFQGSNGALTAVAQGGNGGYQYAWNGGMFQTTPTLSNQPAGNYELIVRDSRGCEARSNITITQPSQVTLQLNVSPIRCQGIADGTVEAVAIGGVGGFTYNWNPGGPGSAQRTNLGPGTYCVTVADANGCSVSDCTTLTEPTPIQIDSVSVKAVSCFGGNNGEATVFASGGSQPYAYRWDDPAQQTSRTAVFLTAGNFRVVVTDNNGCNRDRSVSVPEPSPLNATFQLSHPRCGGENSGTITAQIQGGTAPYAYRWDNGQTMNSVGNLNEGVYYLTVTDGNGCRLETQATLVAPMPLTLSVSQSFQGCFGLSDNEATATVSGGTAPYSYQWSNGRIGNPAIDMLPGVHSLTVTDANNCTVVSQVILTDLNSLQANIIADMPTCFGAADGALGVNIITGGAGGTASEYTFQWSNGASGPVALNLLGGIMYSLTITDRQGCTGVFTRLLTQPSRITFDLTPVDARCFGNADGTATVSNIQGDNTRFSIQWDAAARNQTTPTADGLSAGRYRVTVTDNDGCFSEGEVVIGQPEDIVLSLELTPNPCFGDAKGAARISARGGTPGYTFTWPDNRTGAEISALPAGTYTATVTDSKGCRKTIDAVITQPEQLSGQTSVQDVSCHGGRNGIITLQMTGGTLPYQFSTDNRNFNGNNVLIGLKAGNYSLYVKDANNCIFFTQATVNQPDKFQVDAGPASHIIRLGDSVTLSAAAVNAQGNVRFLWSASYGNTLSCTECPVTVARPTDQIHYELYGIDDKGCEARDQVAIFVEKERIALVPTGFSPNNDGTNDRLLVHGREGTRVLFFRIFDRWGQLVYQGGSFEVNDEAFGWDGYFRGSPAPSGTYIWHLEVEYPDGVKETRQGQTTLIR